MDRAAWLRERRGLVEERYDTLFAPSYDVEHGRVASTHGAFLERFLRALPPRARILDAACGTGKYWRAILASGRHVVGVDRSEGMLRRAREKHPEIEAHRLALQEVEFVREFDGALCVDAMELVPPEDWPVVLANLHGALRPAGRLYVTVELAQADEVRAAHAAGLELGLPVVEGEWAHEGGYHYYPPLEDVLAWIHEAGFEVLEAGWGDGYEHYVLQRGMR